jgi:hypothetical protein
MGGSFSNRASMDGVVPLLVAALLAVAVAACGDRAPQAAKGRPKIAPAGLEPFRIVGTGFAAHERVRVTVTPSTGEPIVRRVRAGVRGGFTVSFPAVEASGGLEAVATGSAGGHASFQYSTGIG